MLAFDFRSTSTSENFSEKTSMWGRKEGRREAGRAIGRRREEGRID